MEFLKRSWMKLLGVVLFATAGVFALVTSICAMRTASAMRAIPEAQRPILGAPGIGIDYDVALSQASGGSFIYLAVALSSFFIVAFLCLSLFNIGKKIPSVSLIVGSMIALVLFIVGIVMAGDYLSDLAAAVDAARELYNLDMSGLPPHEQLPIEIRRALLNGAQAAHITQIAQTVIFTIAFALLPLVVGVKKLRNKTQ